MKYLDNPWCLMIMDDVIDDSSDLGKDPIPQLFKRGRHWALMQIYASQYCMDIPSKIRSCIDYVFLMCNDIPGELEKLYKNFAPACIPTLQDFIDIMSQLTEDHTALVIDNTTQSGKLIDRVFYFKADIGRVPIGFRVGCDDAFEFSRSRIDPNFNETIM